MKIISKKAASLTFQTIVLAALSMIVLVVLLYLLFGASTGADQSTKCSLKGGICVSSNSCPSSGVYTSSIEGDDLCPNNNACCAPDIGS